MSQVIRTALERILAPVDAAWEKSIVDAYVAEAYDQMKRWAAYLAAPEPTLRCDRLTARELQFVLWTKPAGYVEDYRMADHFTFQKRLAAGEYSADVAGATKEGKRQYHLIREAFLTRVTEKIAYVVQDQSACVAGQIRFGRMIEGSIEVTVAGDRHQFGLNVAVKTNYRYGVNSANHHLTVYSQYPVTFTRAYIENEPSVIAPSEEWLAHKIGGLSLNHKVRVAQVEKDRRLGLKIEKQRLERLRETYRNIATDYESIAYYERCLADPQSLDTERLKKLIAEYRDKIAERCTKAGITDPGSKRAANLLRKETIACIKEIGNVRTAKV